MTIQRLIEVTILTCVMFFSVITPMEAHADGPAVTVSILEINPTASIIHTSGGLAGEGVGDLPIEGLFQVEVAENVINFRNISVPTVEGFIFPDFSGTYDGYYFSGEQENYDGFPTNTYSGSFDGTWLSMEGTYFDPGYDGVDYHYEINADVIAPENENELVYHDEDKIYTYYDTEPVTDGLAGSFTTQEKFTNNSSLDNPDPFFECVRDERGSPLICQSPENAPYALPADYDGDGCADLATFQPIGGRWHILYSGSGERGDKQFGWDEIQFGWDEVIPVPADYDGDKDNTTDIAVYHPESATWHIKGSDAGSCSIQFGWDDPTLKPVPGDYNGDGDSDIALYHKSAGGMWYIFDIQKKEEENGKWCKGNWFYSHGFGWQETDPVPADYDGDGKADLAVYHQVAGDWYILKSQEGFFTDNFGWFATVPVPADYDGDVSDDGNVRTDLAVYNPITSTWYILASTDGFSSHTFEWEGSPPVLPADYDCDQKADIATYDQQTGKWYIDITLYRLTFENKYSSITSVKVSGDDNPIFGMYKLNDEVLWEVAEPYVEPGAGHRAQANPAGGKITVTSDETVEVNWEEEYKITVKVVGSGTVSPQSGWYKSGTNLPFTESPSANHKFVEWRVDGRRLENPFGKAVDSLKLVVDSPHTVSARFVEETQDSDSDGLLDWQEYYYFGHLDQDDTTDYDGDGHLDHWELQNGTDPTDPESVVEVADTKFSHGRGFYALPFNLVITTETPNATIMYTTDGSTPSIDNGEVYAEKIRISGTTVLRAMAFRENMKSTNVDTQTYLFIEDIVTQSGSPSSYPETWGGDVAADYGMDPKIIRDPVYGPLIRDSLKAIPTLSIVMDQSDLFGTDGLYDKDTDEGFERATSVELIYPDGRKGVQADASIKPHGNFTMGSGTSYDLDSVILKRSFRLSFKEEYGTKKLRYNFFENAPLNADSAVKEFDRLILRSGTQRNYAGTTSIDQRLTTYAEDQWGRDSQIAASGLGSHGTFVHLYLNGMYWGVYNAVERPDAWFTSAYLGGEKEEWYAGNHSGDISGAPERWKYLIEKIAASDLSNPHNYDNARDYLEMTSFIDYILIWWMAGGGDWEEVNTTTNNFYVGNRNIPGPGPTRYFVWDMEYSWLKTFISSDGAWVKPTFLDGIFNPGKNIYIARLFRALWSNGEFRILFADRLYTLFFNDGPLSDRGSQTRWISLTNYIKDAMIAESARWGDGKAPFSGGEDVLTRDDHWYPARDRVYGLMSGNVQKLVNECRSNLISGNPLYPIIDPPVFNRTSTFLVEMTCTSGTIYYTLDGSDPRAEGGAKSSEALEYTGPVNITDPLTIKARAKSGGIWSALHEEEIYDITEASSIQVTELMYHPSDDEDYEFIELRNIADSPADLSGMYFFDGIRFTFPNGTQLAPGEYIVLAPDAGAFADRYPGIPLFAEYAGQLSNSGETVTLVTATGEQVLSFTYDDKSPWPEEPDGDGYSLVIIDAYGDPNDPENWRASAHLHGSPGADDVFSQSIANSPPVVSAGPDQLVMHEGKVSLKGSVIDDGLPEGVLSITWQMEKGPDTVTFTDSSDPQTKVTFSESGTYVLRLTASDGLYSSSARCNITVISSDLESFGEIEFWLRSDGPMDIREGRIKRWIDHHDTSIYAGQDQRVKYRPELLNNAFNGERGVLFDGVDDFMELIGVSSQISSEGPYPHKTLLVAFRTGTDVQSRQVLYEQGGTDSGLNVYVEGGKILGCAWSSPDGWGPVSVAYPVIAEMQYSLELVLDGPAGIFMGWLNGRELEPSEWAGILSGSSDGIGIGGIVGSTRFHDGTVAGEGSHFGGILFEILHYNGEISEENTQELRDYQVLRYTPSSGIWFEPDPPDEPPLPNEYCEWFIVNGSSVKVCIGVYPPKNILEGSTTTLTLTIDDDDIFYPPFFWSVYYGGGSIRGRPIGQTVEYKAPTGIARREKVAVKVETNWGSLYAVMTVLPRTLPPKGFSAASGKHRRVSVQGVPLPDPDPTGEGESDRAPNKAHIEMYSLLPTYSVTDAAVPVVGDELLLEFRRTFGHRTYNEKANKFANEFILGPGWSSSLGSHILMRKSDTIHGYTVATVIDDQGASYQYHQTSTGKFSPDVISTINNDALRSTLKNVEIGGSDFLLFTRKFKTKLYYELAQSIFGDITEHYYRLHSIEDRNGNRLIYNYNESDPTLVSSIEEERRPIHNLKFKYKDIGENPLNMPSWRLISMTDPLNNETMYQYFEYADVPHDPQSVGYLKEVNRPEVYDAEPEVHDAESGSYRHPTIRFGYDVRELSAQQYNEQGYFFLDQEDKSIVLHVCPFRVIDARGHMTTFQYSNDLFPQTIYEGVVVSVERPYLTSVTTRTRDRSERTAKFHQIRRVMNRHTHRVMTSVTDTRGVETEYVFSGGLGNEADSWWAYVDKVTRRTLDSTGSHDVTFEYSPDKNGNLLKVTDISGNIIEYGYEGQNGGDTYDYALWNQPAEKIVDPDPHNPDPDDPEIKKIKTQYRYDSQFNKLIERIDGKGVKTTYELDGRGNRTAVIEADGTEDQRRTDYKYDVEGFIYSIKDDEDRFIDFEKDDFGYQKTKTVYEGFNRSGRQFVTITENDAMGNMLSQTDPNLNTTSYEYDNLHRLMLETKPPVRTEPEGLKLSSTIEHRYDLNGNEVLTVIGNGNNSQAVVQRYDAMNRLTEKRIRMTGIAFNNDDNDIITSHTYNPIGQLETTTDPRGNTTEFSYDALTRLVKKTLPTGDTEKYEYGPNSGSGVFWLGGFQPTRVINPRGYATDTKYDAAYRPTQVINRKDNPAPDYSDPPLADEPVVKTEYNKVHKKIKDTVLNDNVEEQVTQYEYDDLRRLTAVIDPMGFRSQTEYDLSDNVDAETDAEGRRTEHFYDGANRLVKTKQPKVLVYIPGEGQKRVTPTADYEYDDNGNRTAVIDPNRNRTEHEYDARNRLTKTIVDPGGKNIITESYYDFADNPILAIDGKGSKTWTIYDKAYRAIEVRGPPVYNALSGDEEPPVTKTDYDRNSNVIRLTDPRLILTETEYDALNRPTEFYTAKNTSEELHTETEYDANGNVTAMILHNKGQNPDDPDEASAQKTTYKYDAFDRKYLEILPDIGDGDRPTETAYYRNSNIKTVTDPKGQTAEYQYYLNNWIWKTSFKRANGSLEETRRFTYDKIGNIRRAYDLHGSTTYRYDELYRVRYETRATRARGLESPPPLPPYTVKSWCDANGNRTKVVYPRTGRTLISHYNERNLLTRMEDGPKQSLFDYDDNGNQVRSETPNQVETSNEFDALNRISRRWAAKDSTNIYTVTYEYDLVGNRWGINETIAGQGTRHLTYNYDHQHRLTSESWTLTPRLGAEVKESYAYIYDLAGNRMGMMHVKDRDTETTTYEYDDLNRLLSATTNGAVTEYDYDRNGNRIFKIDDGEETVYNFDVHNRLESVQQGSETVFQATYDYRTRRLTKVEDSDTIYFRYDGGVSFHELKNGSLTVEFIRGTGLGGGIGSILYADRTHSGGDEKYFTYNAVGHTVALTDANGNGLKTDLYEAFGNISSSIGTSPNNRLANTKERDFSIGLDNHGMRYYDPAIGRYLTRDPIGYADGLNVYLHVHNNPINHIDPLGLSWWSDTWSVTKAALMGASEGALIAIDTFTFGKIGAIHEAAEVYQGAEHQMARHAARISRTAALSAVGGSLSAAAAQGSTTAQVAVTGSKLITATSAAKSAGQNLGEASVEFQTGDFGMATLHATLGAVDLYTAGSTGISAAGDISKMVGVTPAPQGEISPEGTTAPKKPVKPGDRGTYSELKQRKKDFGQTEPVEMHEMPSYAAKKEAFKQKYGHYPKKAAERKMVRDAGISEAMTPDVHRQTRTYGGRNSPSKIQQDAADLGNARKLDEQDLRNITR